jgi:GntR family transcriptional regulator
MKEPVYSVIASRAEARIRSGQWAPGSRLPSERVLCNILDVSRATLRQALAELEERGLISRHQGRGTFVARPRVEAALSGFFSIREALHARGMTVVTRVLGVTVVEASRQLSADLGCLPGDPLVRLERLRLVETEPLVLESSHLPGALFPDLVAADFVTRSLYDILREDYGRAVSDAIEMLEPVITTARESALLGLPGHAPAILTRRVTKDTSGTIVELGHALLRGDRSRFLLQRHAREPWATHVSLDEAETTETMILDTPDVAGLVPSRRCLCHRCRAAR